MTPNLGERETMRSIRQAVAAGRIPVPFRAAHVNHALGIDWAGVFLPKHREGNPGVSTELFVQIERRLYRLR